MKDRISELPDEILVCIVSLLTMKEAARTSVLSRRWIDLWKFYSGDLDFDGSTTMIRLMRQKKVYEAEVPWYTSWVDQVLNSHKGLEIEKFRIRYSLEKHHKHVIDRWINFAMGKKIKRFELDLYSCYSSHGEHDYSFPSSLLTPLAFANFKNLRGLCLAAVDVTEEDIAYFLANCGLLEQFTVRGASSLVNLKITSHTLRSIEVSKCMLLNSIEICARKLHSFTYRGHAVSIGYDDTPSLKDTSLGGGRSFVEYVLQTLDQHPLILFQVKTLTLKVFIFSGCCLLFPRTFPQICNVRQLVLDLDMHQDQRCILHLYSLIAASVRLKKLVVKFVFGKWERNEPTFDCRNEVERMGRILRNHFHSNLKIVEFVGWHGLEADMGFAKFIIEHAALRKVIINPRNSDAFGRWWYSSERAEREEEIENVARERARQLGEILHPRVKLVIL